MNGLRSPDIPAYLSYAVVIIVGAVVAFSSVNILLAEKRDRWAYTQTWLLFLAYASLPVTLFWLLDYNGVISDTSLFAAIVTAVAYKYIFAGAVEGIRLPGQTSAFWKLFEAWVARVEQRIDRLNQARYSRLTEQILGRIAPSPDQLAVLEQLAGQRTLDHPALVTRLAQIRAQPLPAPRIDRDVAKVLWDDIRLSSPDTYGELLRDHELVSPRTYWLAFRNGRAVLMSATMVAIGTAAMFVLVWALKPLQNDLTLSYHQWRFVRATATAADEYRTRNALLNALRDEQRVEGSVSSLAEILTYRDLPLAAADRILDLVLFSHDQRLTPRTIPPLIGALRSPNPDIRLRIHQALKDLQAAEYPPVSLTGELAALASWVPGKGDAPGNIDSYIRLWRKWWSRAQSPPAQPTAANEVEKALTAGEFTAENLAFDSGRAVLRPEAFDVLKKVSQAMQAHPEWVVLVTGHTDDVGSEAFNLDLSNRRAAAVVDYLKRQGLPTARLRSEGKGETDLLIRDVTPEARRRNRRVVFSKQSSSAGES